MSQPSERTTDTAEQLDRADRVDPVDSATEVFVAHRNLLFTVAYRLPHLLFRRIDDQHIRARTYDESWLKHA